MLCNHYHYVKSFFITPQTENMYSLSNNSSFSGPSTQFLPFPCTLHNLWHNYLWQIDLKCGCRKRNRHVSLGLLGFVVLQAVELPGWPESSDYSSQAFFKSLPHRLRAPCREEVITLCLLYPWICVFVHFSGREIESEKHGRWTRNNVQIGKH